VIASGEYVGRTDQIDFNVNRVVCTREHKSYQENNPDDLVDVGFEFFIVSRFAHGYVAFYRENRYDEQVHVQKIVLKETNIWV